MKASLLVLALTTSFASSIALAQEDDSILADEYIIAQEYIEADVVRVRPSARKITVRGEKHGRMREFSVPEGTRISVNGHDARLRDLRPGDRVLLVMRPHAEEVVITRVNVPESPTTVEERRAEPQAVAEARPATLPDTAGNAPLMLAIGMIALLGAGLLRAVRVRG